MLDFTNKYKNQLMKRLLIALTLVFAIGCKQESKKTIATPSPPSYRGNKMPSRWQRQRPRMKVRPKSLLKERIPPKRPKRSQQPAAKLTRRWDLTRSYSYEGANSGLSQPHYTRTFRLGAMPAECAMPAKFGIWLSLPLQTGTRSSYEKNPCSLTEAGR